MAVQIVMDRTGDTRHEFDVAELRGLWRSPKSASATDRQRLPRRRAERRRQPRQARAQVRSARRADLVHPAAARRLMERVRNLLRALLRRALSEHGRDAPALTRHHHRTSVRALRAPARRAFLQRLPHLGAAAARRLLRLLRAARDLGSGQPSPRPAARGAARFTRRCARSIWPSCGRQRASAGAWRPAMASHRARRRRRRSRRARAIRSGASAEPDARARRTRPVAAGETQRRLLALVGPAARRAGALRLVRRRLSADIGSKRAQERGIQLLKENLAPPSASSTRNMAISTSPAADRQALPHPPRPADEYRAARQERPARVRLVLLPAGQPGGRRRHAGAEGGARALRGRGAAHRQPVLIRPAPNETAFPLPPDRFPRKSIGGRRDGSGPLTNTLNWPDIRAAPPLRRPGGRAVRRLGETCASLHARWGTALLPQNPPLCSWRMRAAVMLNPLGIGL